MATNYGVARRAHHQALEVAPRLFGPTLPPPCDPPAASTAIVDSWPRADAAVGPAAGQTMSRRNRRDAVVHVAVQLANHRADVERLRDSRHRSARSSVSANPRADPSAPWRLTLRYPNVWTPTVHEGGDDASGQVYLGFSRTAGGTIRGRRARAHDRPLERHAVSPAALPGLDEPGLARQSRSPRPFALGADGQVLRSRSGVSR